MSNNILTNNTLPNPVVISNEEKAQRISNQIAQMSKELYNDMIRTQRRGIEMVWEHSDLTAQEVFNALGTRGEKICIFHAALTQFILTLAQMENIDVDLKFPTHNMQVNGGVVTVTNEPYTIPQ